MAKYNDLNGMQNLWDIVLQATETKVVKEASSYLISLHLNFDPVEYQDNNEEKLEIWKGFVDQCVQNMLNKDLPI